MGYDGLTQQPEPEELTRQINIVPKPSKLPTAYIDSSQTVIETQASYLESTSLNRLAIDFNS